MLLDLIFLVLDSLMASFVMISNLNVSVMIVFESFFVVIFGTWCSCLAYPSHFMLLIGRGSGLVAVEILFTPRAERVLELSLEEARQLGKR
jgi:hypothetical protein